MLSTNRSAALARTVLVGALVLASAACTARSSSSGSPSVVPAAPAASAPSATVSAPAPAAAAWGGDACRQSGVSCQVHAGLPTALVASSGGRTGDVVLVDLGGPGGSMEQTLESVTELSVLADHDILVVGEPSEVSPPSEACLTAEAARIRSWSTLSSGASCDLRAWQFSATNYRSAVAAALSAEGGRLSAAVGVSFGAVRVAAATPATVPLLLLSPAPVTTGAAQLATARADAMARQASAACAGAPACAGAIERLRTRVTGDRDYRMALALIGAARDPALFDATARALSDTPTAEQAADQERQAFAATFRYSDGAVLPNLLSYRAGTCGFYGAAGVAPQQGLAQVLARVLSCPAGETGTSSTIDLTGRSGCALTAASDLVTPSVLTTTWTTGSSGIRLVAGGISTHGALDDQAAVLLSHLPASLGTCRA